MKVGDYVVVNDTDFPQGVVLEVLSDHALVGFEGSEKPKLYAHISCCVIQEDPRGED